jgi:hypothetical protein
LNRLETCRYQGQVLVSGENVGALPLWLAGDRILFVGRGEVVAGVDLARLRPEDVRTRGRAVTLHLPAAQILHTRLDSAGSEVYERRSGILSGPDANLESRVRVQAEQRIRQAALAGGVLREAEQNARQALRRHLELLGFREVEIL